MDYRIIFLPIILMVLHGDRLCVASRRLLVVDKTLMDFEGIGPMFRPISPAPSLGIILSPAKPFLPKVTSLQEPLPPPNTNSNPNPPSASLNQNPLWSPIAGLPPIFPFPTIPTIPAFPLPTIPTIPTKPSFPPLLLPGVQNPRSASSLDKGSWIPWNLYCTV